MSGIDRDEWRGWAADGIQRHRMGVINVRVLSPDGKPARGAVVQISQKRHLFSFGAELRAEWFEPQPTEPETQAMYQGMIKGLFNCGVAGRALDWRETEPNPGAAQFEHLDRIAHWCEQQRLSLAGHSLVVEAEQSVPNWVKALDDATLREVLERRVRTLCRRYRGQIDEYVVNAGMLNADFYATRLGVDIHRRLFLWAQEEDPDARLYVNEPNVLDGQDLAVYDGHIEILLRAGAPVGGIGCVGRFGPEALEIDRRVIWHALDQLSRFQLPVKLTEVSVVAGDDEAAQAALLRDVYTIAFGHPAVEGVELAGFWRQAHPEPGAELFDNEFRPTLAGQVYRELIFGDWWTRAEATADERGFVSVPAFYGVHSVRAALAGTDRATERQIILTPQGLEGGLQEISLEI